MPRHAGSVGRMLEIAVRLPFLAFSIPGVAPDEHLSGTQPNEWSRHEHHVSPLPH